MVVFRGNVALDGAETLFPAQGFAEYIEIGYFNIVSNETFWKITPVNAYAFVFFRFVTGFVEYN